MNCAHSIIDLIKEFWYDSIDILGRERGIVDGMRPIFVDGWDETQFKHFFAENKYVYLTHQFIRLLKA